jgi:hydroxymethylbilane synthase
LILECLALASSFPDRLVIGTRRSPLALRQAEEARARLAAASGRDPEAMPLSPMTTSGDRIQDRALAEAGGKGLFTKELDAALLDGRIDLAVHSAKDLPTDLPDDIAIAGYLPREDVRDAFISRRAESLAALPPGAVVGTASLRRQAQVQRLRPDLSVALLRGNVGTRLARIERGEFDATLLALAGLKRLGLAHEATAILDVDIFLPAVGQGAIALVARAGDAATLAAVSTIAHGETGIALAAERAFLRVLDGSCRTPIAGHATVSGDEVHVRGLLLSPDGRQSIAVERRGSVTDAAALGADAGREVVDRAGPGLLG